MNDFVRPCPACGADRALGQRFCPACGASWRHVPADARKGPSARRDPQMDTDGLPGPDRGPQRPPRGSLPPGGPTWIWIRALAWVAAGWLGMDAVVHLLGMGRGGW